MSRVEFELPPLTLAAMDETWVPRDGDGMIERELVIVLDDDSYRKLFHALPCTERYTWPLGNDDKPIGDLVIRRPVVFRRRKSA